jgi:hypothetical protein
MLGGRNLVVPVRLVLFCFGFVYLDEYILVCTDNLLSTDV